MIAPLRRRHRLAVVALTAAVPAIAALALAWRAPPPELRAPVERRPALPVIAELSFPAVPLNLRVRSFMARRRLLLELEPRETAALTAPDVLVYWSATDPGSGDDLQLTADAVLLGAFAGTYRRFGVPATGGTVILYSLAHRAVIDRVALPGAAAAP